ncbi:MAG TPA: hypothetical protein VJ385_20990 [Fibrobacteria bacterium]|nr:hypothetical protein [Fibrobacteria bacterium]
MLASAVSWMPQPLDLSQEIFQPARGPCQYGHAQLPRHGRPQLQADEEEHHIERLVIQAGRFEFGDIFQDQMLKRLQLIEIDIPRK